MECLPDDVAKLVFEDVIDRRADLMSMRLVCREWEVMSRHVVEDAHMEELCAYLRAMRIAPTSRVPKRWVLRYAGAHRYNNQPLVEAPTLPTYVCAGCGTRRGELLAEDSCCKRRKKMRARLANLVIGPAIAFIVLLAFVRIGL